MGAQKAACQVAFVAEEAALSNLDFGAGLLDLLKAFETVPHEILAELAHTHGYPLVLLRLGLASYRMNRTICVDGVCSEMLVATRGITAGSGNAAAELKLLLLPLMILLQQNWATALIAKIYVDDLTLIVIGSANHVVGLMSLF